MLFPLWKVSFDTALTAMTIIVSRVSLLSFPSSVPYHLIPRGICRDFKGHMYSHESLHVLSSWHDHFWLSIV